MKMRLGVVLWCVMLLVAVPQARASAWTWGSYPDAVQAAQPELYWRLGETQGTTIADASGHGHTGTLASPASDRTRPGALVGDADGAFGGGVVWYGSSYDLIHLAAPTGLPAGDPDARGLGVGGQRGGAGGRVRRLQRGPGGARAGRLRRAALACPRRHAAPDRQPLAPGRRHVRGRDAHRLPRRRAFRVGGEGAEHGDRRSHRRAHPRRRERRLRRARPLPDRLGRLDDRRALRGVRQREAARAGVRAGRRQAERRHRQPGPPSAVPSTTWWRRGMGTRSRPRRPRTA